MGQRGLIVGMFAWSKAGQGKARNVSQAGNARIIQVGHPFDPLPLRTR